MAKLNLQVFEFGWLRCPEYVNSNGKWGACNVLVPLHKVDQITTAVVKELGNPDIYELQIIANADQFRLHRTRELAEHLDAEKELAKVVFEAWGRYFNGNKS